MSGGPYKVRLGPQGASRGRSKSYEITVPREIAEALAEGARFWPELTDAGLLFRFAGVGSQPDVVTVRLAALDRAVRTMAWWLVQAQTGFGQQDARGIEAILDGKREDDAAWTDVDAEAVASAYLELLEQTAAPGGADTPAENSAPSARTDGARTPEAGAAA